MTIGERIQTLRKKQGLSQEELANKIYVSRQAVSKWESNQSNPDLKNIVALSEVFKTSTDSILKDSLGDFQAFQSNNPLFILAFALTFFILVGVWAYSANRFREDEIFWMAFLSAIAGGSLGYIVQVILHKNRKNQ
ncbi:helix-turn-helix domain-containing protein [Facklamia sp. P12934]|uniref:helix-turn-helix domain-containing protein n=1 Tax=Facklamia sp. P12934 TaxID=3421948 RepID=UPI003D16F49F